MKPSQKIQKPSKVAILQLWLSFSCYSFIFLRIWVQLLLVCLKACLTKVKLPWEPDWRNKTFSKGQKTFQNIISSIMPQYQLLFFLFLSIWVHLLLVCVMACLAKVKLPWEPDWRTKTFSKGQKTFQNIISSIMT